MRRSARGMPTSTSDCTDRSRASFLETSLWSSTASLSCQPIDLTGFRDVIGSWKIIAMREPRSSRSRLLLAARRFSPSSSASPVDVLERGLLSPMIVEARDALAASRLAHDAERLALLDREA